MHLSRADLLPFEQAGRITRSDVARLEHCLREHGTLTFHRLESGLFPASPAGERVAHSGYEYVWVRDNVWVAYGHLIAGDVATATGVAVALATFFYRYRHRFDAIIDGSASPDDDANRPHVRLNGRDLTEVTNEEWAHAQNDALGYFVWLFAQLAARGHVGLDEMASSLLARFVRYFAAIEFWQDKDSGHWEEQRKISASSIGTVVAGLEQLLLLDTPDQGEIARLIALGRGALADILPFECRQEDPLQNRKYDAALLFLVHPLGVVDGDMAAKIVTDITIHLAGEIGIRRYLGDSYWAPNYDAYLDAPDRTRNFSKDIERRNALLKRIGDEAQWCLFDPVLSAYFGVRGDRLRQLHHLRRTLAQLTEAWECPELYYWRGGHLTPGPHIPLQWSQANLLLALNALRATAE